MTSRMRVLAATAPKVVPTATYPKRAEEGDQREPAQYRNEREVIPEACRENHDDFRDPHEEQVGEHLAEVNRPRVYRGQAHTLQPAVLALRRKRPIESQHAGKGKRNPHEAGQQSQRFFSPRLEGKVEQENDQ